MYMSIARSASSSNAAGSSPKPSKPAIKSNTWFHSLSNFFRVITISTHYVAHDAHTLPFSIADANDLHYAYDSACDQSSWESMCIAAEDARFYRDEEGDAGEAAVGYACGILASGMGKRGNGQGNGQIAPVAMGQRDGTLMTSCGEHAERVEFVNCANAISEHTFKHAFGFNALLT